MTSTTSFWRFLISSFSLSFCSFRCGCCFIAELKVLLPPRSLIPRVWYAGAIVVNFGRTGHIYLFDLCTTLTPFQAMQTILLGKPITAVDGLSHGLVCELFEDGTVLDKTVKVAADLAANATEAMQLAKEAICRGKGHPDSTLNFCRYHHHCYR